MAAIMDSDIEFANPVNEDSGNIESSESAKAPTTKAEGEQKGTSQAEKQHHAFLATLSVGSEVAVGKGKKRKEKPSEFLRRLDRAQITGILGAGYTIDWSDGHDFCRVVSASDIYGGSGHEIGDTVSANYDEVQLTLECHKLRSMDTFSKSDPIVICSVRHRDAVDAHRYVGLGWQGTVQVPTHSWREVQRTEVIQNCLHPKFKVKVKAFHWPEKDRVYKFDCYDVDENNRNQRGRVLRIIGTTGPLQLAEIVAAGHHRTALLTEGGKNKGYGDMTITATILRTFDGTIAEIHRCPLPPASTLDICAYARGHSIG